MDITKKTEILRVKHGVVSEEADIIVTEHTLSILVNGQQYTTLACTPQYLEELALGNLYSTGSISRLSDVKQMIIDADNRTIRIEAVCSDAPLEAVPDGLNVSAADILLNMEQFLSESEIFIATGAVHSCALIVDNKLIHFTEDIGRHNALDKTIGLALKAKTPLEDVVVVTSGRVPADVMNKIIRSRVKIVVSRSAPTDTAIDLALRHNVTLCGFARKNRLNIYTHGNRIVLHY